MDEDNSDVPTTTETNAKIDVNVNNDNGTKGDIDISNNHTDARTNDDEKENTIRNDNKAVNINGERCDTTSDDVKKTGVDNNTKTDEQQLVQADTVLQVNEEVKADEEGSKPDVDMMKLDDEEMKPDGGDMSGERSKPDEEMSGEGSNPEEGSKRGEGSKPDEGLKPDTGNNIDDENESKQDGNKEEIDDKDVHDMDNIADADKQDNGDENGENGDDANDNSDEDDDPFAELDDVATMDLYNIGNYTFGKKDTESKSKAMSEMSGRAISNALRLEYERRGLRRSVRAVILVHEHNFPHILLLQRLDGKGEFSLPGGRLRAGEDFEQGLLRKLSAKLCTGDAQAAASASLNEDNDLDKDISNDMDGSEGKATLEVGDKCKNIKSLKCEILFVLFFILLSRSLVHGLSSFQDGVSRLRRR